MRPAKLRAYATMMPRIEAAERLHLLADVAVGTASVKKEAAQQHQQELQRVANGGSRPKARQPTTADLSAMGVKIITADD